MFLDTSTLQYSNKALKNDLMYFQHVYDKTLAQASYFIGCQKAGVAAVIDPKRDIDTYLEIAKQNNMQITHVFETHIHADFLSGARELAAVTGAKMYLSLKIKASLNCFTSPSHLFLYSSGLCSLSYSISFLMGLLSKLTNFNWLCRFYV